MELSEAISFAKRGESVLFTGAGFSIGAKNSLPSPDNGIPTARTFSKRLSALISLPETYDLPVISQFYARKKGEHSLVAELLNCFTVTEAAPYHTTIASVPWRRVYTTNYDNCFEFAALRGGIQWIPLTVDAPLTAEKNRCVHVNGHISNLTINSIQGQVRLTHSSYSADSFSNSKWAQQMRQDLSNSRSIFFVGYSRSDIDIARILFRSPELRERTFFVVSPESDEVTTFPLEDFGQVLHIGTERLANLVTETELIPQRTEYEYTWLKQYDPSLEPLEPSDKEGLGLLTQGIVNQRHVIWAMAADRAEYMVRRECISDIMKEVDRNHRWFIVHSDLGNGKSMVKHQLSHLLSRRGYDVFWDSDNELNRASDLRRMALGGGLRAVFIDESSDRFEAIDGILALNLQDVLVFVCVRTTLYELGQSKYEGYLPDDYVPLDINRLTDSDVSELVSIFNAMGLWGGLPISGDADKANYIKTECNRSVARLIISAYEHSEVGRQITRGAEKILNSVGAVAEIIVLSFLMNRIGHPPRPTIISEILNVDVWPILNSESFRSAGEIIRFENGAIQSRSSIISEFLLRRALRPERLVYFAEKFVRRLSSIKRDPTMHHIFTELQRFPMIERLISETDAEGKGVRKREVIIGYFQSLKDIKFCQGSALFWLHYAMARLSFGEFKESTIYFKQAQELAKGSAKDTMEVNNHYARLLLESRMKSEEYADYFEAFEMAHAILLEQINRGTNKHFPFRQAKTYAEFISYRKKDMNPGQVKRFKTACSQISVAISHLQGSIAKSSVVTECKFAMERAQAIAGSA
jgi:hypothetical protein